MTGCCTPAVNGRRLSVRLVIHLQKRCWHTCGLQVCLHGPRLCRILIWLTPSTDPPLFTEMKSQTQHLDFSLLLPDRVRLIIKQKVLVPDKLSVFPFFFFPGKPVFKFLVINVCKQAWFFLDQLVILSYCLPLNEFPAVFSSIFLLCGLWVNCNFLWPLCPFCTFSFLLSFSSLYPSLLLFCSLSLVLSRLKFHIMFTWHFHLGLYNTGICHFFSTTTKKYWPYLV